MVADKEGLKDRLSDIRKIPLERLPDVDLSKLGIGLKPIAPRVYANKYGYIIKYWDGGNIIEKKYKTRSAVLEDFEIKNQ